MEWQVEYINEFGAWWDSLTAEEQEEVADRLYDDHLAQLRREGELPNG